MAGASEGRPRPRLDAPRAYINEVVTTLCPWLAGSGRRQAVFAASAAAAFIAAVPGARAVPHDVAVLQALDKITARVSTLEAPVGNLVRFGTLEIIVRICDKRPPEEPPESAAFLDIWEVRRGEPTASVFRGWMFASSPALSALEHPVYDVWVLDCRNDPARPKAGERPPR